MIVVLPVFPRDTREAELSCTPLCGRPLFMRVLDAAVDLPAAEMLVVTDRPEVAAQIEAGDARVRCLIARERGASADERVTEGEGTVLPRGAARSLECVRDVFGPDACRDVLLLDYRHSYLDAESLTRAWQRYRDSDARVLLGLGKVDEHPTQLVHFHRVLALEQLELFESAQESARLIESLAGPAVLADLDVRVGRPSYFDASIHRLPGEGARQLYVQIPAGDRPRVLNADEFLHLRHARSPLELDWFIREGPLLARRVVPSTLLVADDGSELVGRSFPGGIAGPGGIAARPGGTSETLEIFALEEEREGEHDELLVRAWSSGESGLDGGFLEAELGGRAARTAEPGREALQIAGRVFVGPLLALPRRKDVSGLTVALLGAAHEEAEWGCADLSEPLEVVEPIWEVDEETQCVFDGATGRPIHGRQDFPPVYVSEPAFVFLRDGADAADGQPRVEDVEGFPLPALAARKICGELDLLWCAARSGGNESSPC